MLGDPVRYRKKEATRSDEQFPLPEEHGCNKDTRDTDNCQTLQYYLKTRRGEEGGGGGPSVVGKGAYNYISSAAQMSFSILPNYLSR